MHSRGFWPETFNVTAKKKKKVSICALLIILIVTREGEE